jgi:hypothetical protein
MKSNFQNLNLGMVLITTCLLLGSCKEEPLDGNILFLSPSLESIKLTNLSKGDTLEFTVQYKGDSEIILLACSLGMENTSKKDSYLISLKENVIDISNNEAVTIRLVHTARSFYDDSLLTDAFLKSVGHDPKVMSTELRFLLVTKDFTKSIQIEMSNVIWNP